MQITRKDTSNTQTTLTITADLADIQTAKDRAVKYLAPKVKVQGFREGKVPPALVEKNLDPNYLQAEVIDNAINALYGEALVKEDLRPVAQPKIDLTKFVPYTALEFKAEIEVISKVTLPDYKKLASLKPAAKVVVKDVTEVLERLQLQGATYKVVERAAKNGDKVTIDFEGTDNKGEAVAGAKGDNYPLVLGSKTFIPGFEEKLVGQKSGSDIKFDITFPKDYGVKALQNKKVTFAVKVNKVEEAIKQKLDDAFAKTVGPFKDIAELKKDIEKQLTEEKKHQAQKEFEDDLIKTLAKKTKVQLPKSLVDEQVASLDKEFKQNLTYRGETFKEYLENSSQTEEEYTKNELKPAAEERLRAGLALSEVAEKEKISVTPEDLEIRIQVMKGQYASDKKMQDELDKPENRRDIASRLMTEKTIAKLVNLNSK